MWDKGVASDGTRILYLVASKKVGRDAYLIGYRFGAIGLSRA